MAIEPSSRRDFFRVQGGKIVEHWDGSQDAPATTASGNSVFSDLYKYRQGAPVLTEAQEEANKQMVVTAYSGLFNDRNLALLDQYWDPDYVQHNPGVDNGTQGLRQLIGSMPSGGGGLSISFFESVSDQGLVWTFSQMQGSGVLTDIFRVVDGKIVEHWDVQPR